MPCDQVRTIKVAAGKMVAEHLIKGLEALGYSARQSGTRVSFNKGYYQSGSYDSATGRMELPQGERLEAVKVAYAKQGVAHAARRMGWQQHLNPVTNKITLKRRS